MAAISNQHWRDRAMKQSEVITDIWQVWNSYAGRLAEIILFLCMVVNIIEMLPGVALSDAFTSTVLGVQIVSLDIGGLSLSSMAHHARSQGSTKAADMATLTSRFLIGLMIVTLLTVSVGLLYKDLADVTKQVEKFMILIRIVMSVLYSSVIHSLRSSVLEVSPSVESVQIVEVVENENVPLLETSRKPKKPKSEQKVEPVATRKRDLLGMIEGQMYDKVMADKAVLSELLEEARTISMTDLTLSLQQRFSGYANYITEARVRNVFDAIKSDYPDLAVNTQQTQAEESTPVFTPVEQKNRVTRPLNASKVYTQPSTKKSTQSSTGDAQKRAARVLKKYPDIGPTELAQRAQISKSYASKILAEQAG